DYYCYSTDSSANHGLF
nr:immunoglobulin light chain junction region [Macaca mulatta]MOW31856.1 immunoglobulin light chain junction region [Macaca mulatta]MOW32091.1 immunoglobulin light chain junction region [Macaca mulatta]MOX33779.1 immunoglobulin light chain junction region [Macaca mulatta]MOX36399.1 immunoglobulin light chain junction region [Macaca mulatta]